MMTLKGRNNMILAVAIVGIAAAMMLQRNYQQRTMEHFADASVVGKGKPVLLELGSHQCVPCREMTPILSELAEKYPAQFTVSFVDVWQDPTVGEKYGISVIPTQIFFDKDGGELFRHEGFLSKAEILAKWKELGVELP